MMTLTGAGNSVGAGVVQDPGVGAAKGLLSLAGAAVPGLGALAAIPAVVQGGMGR